MNLLIIEPEASGHHIVSYTRRIVAAASRRGWQFQLMTTREAISHPAFRILENEVGQEFGRILMPRVVSPGAYATSLELVRYQFQQYRAMSSTYQSVDKKNRPDAVYVVNFDHMDKVLALLGSPFGSTEFAGMLMTIKFHHRRMGIDDSRSRSDLIYALLFRRLLRIPTLRGLTAIDEPLLEYLQLTQSPHREKVRFLPDPIPLKSYDLSYPQARSMLGIDSSKTVILVYGALSNRKGIQALLKILSDPTCPAEVVVLLAGQQDSDIHELLQSPANTKLRSSGRIIGMSGFLDDRQEYQAYRAADLVWVGYVNYSGMSGVLVSAAAMGIPAIACRNGLIGWETNRYALGETVDVADHQEILQAVLKLVSDEALRANYGKNGLRMAAMHSGPRFGEAICDIFGNTYANENDPDISHASDDDLRQRTDGNE